MATERRAIENAASGERIVFLRTAEETAGELLVMEDIWTAGDHRTAAHVHPKMEERWTVLAGMVRFTIGGRESTAAAGETCVAPAGTPHSACNAGGQPVRLRIEMRPALRWQRFVERLFALPAGPAGPDGGAVAALVREFSAEIAPAP